MGLSEDTIQSDLYIAKHIFYDDKGKDAWHRNPQLLNMCAYHCEQAIEKTLKLFLQSINEDAYRSVANSHNISELLVKMQCNSENFIENHKELAHNADTITKMNNLRYGVGEVSKNDCYIVLSNAKSLFAEYQKIYGKEHIRTISSLDGNKHKQTEADNSKKVNFTMKRIGSERD